jgi:3-methyladenine DNA glycosylase/8-oxoguanine DNA glycosylase
MNRKISPRKAVLHLSAADPVMKSVIERVGPFRLRTDGSDPFASLSRAIVYQQLSGLAAGTIYGRFLALFQKGAGFDREVRRSSPSWKPEKAAFPPPAEVLRKSDEILRSVGLSRQKVAYLKDLAHHFDTGELSPEHFHEWDDEEIITHLTRVKGIGRWTAEMFLIFHLGRPDVLPVVDVGINRALKREYRLRRDVTPAVVARLGKPWHPWATVAAWYLWRSEETRLPDAAR